MRAAIAAMFASRLTGTPGLLAAGTPIWFEGDSNTAFGFNTMNWSKRVLQYSGFRLWLPPGAHLARGGATIAGGDNSMTARLPDLLASLALYPGPKIVWFMIGTNSEPGQTSGYAATTELANWVSQVRAAGAQVWANTCMFNKDGGNTTRITALNAWINTPGNVDRVLNVNPGLFTNSNGTDNTHLPSSQHELIGVAGAALVNSLVAEGTPLSQTPGANIIYSPDFGSWAAQSASGISGSFPGAWTATRVSGTGTLVGSQTTQSGQPAMQLVMDNPAGATANAVFRLRRVITTSQAAGTILDAWLRVGLPASNTTGIAYAGMTVEGGSWPNSLIAGLNYPFPESTGPLYWRTYTTPLAASVTSINFDVTFSVRPGESFTFVLSEPYVATKGVSSAIAPVALTAPVMAALTVGGTPSHTAGTYSGTPVPLIASAYYMDGDALPSGYVFVTGDIGKSVTVLESATNVAGSVEQTSAAAIVGAAATTTTWDATLPAGDPAQLAYSNANTTVSTTASTSSSRFTRGPLAVGKTSGKWYFRVRYDGATGASRTFGVGTSVVGGSNSLTGGTIGTQRFAWAGTNLQTGVNTAMTTNINTTNGEYECVFDATNRLIWVRLSTGNWNNNPAADPAAGTGGVSISGSGTDALYPIAGLPAAAALSSATIVPGTPPAGCTQLS